MPENSKPYFYSLAKNNLQPKQNTMTQNESLQKDVQDAIKWEPLLQAAEIGVTAKDGIITLTGIVDSYAKKIEAENAAKNVIGVKAVVEKIEIKYMGSPQKDDREIAAAIVNAYKWNREIPKDTVKVEVEDGWVTLDGEIQWNYQKEAANLSASKIIGVKGVNNKITIKSETQDIIEKSDIEGALARNWATSNRDIQVSVTGNTVSLNGIVYSLYQKDEAARIAWNAPGAWVVNNNLVVENND
jgi:osmotically-inducible protein OsmY